MGELRAPLEIAPDTLAVVVAFLRGGAPVAIAYDAADPPPALILEDRGPLVALQYRESLAALGLPDGPLALVAEGQSLPEPRSSWVFDYAPTPHWSASPALPDLAKRLKLAQSACGPSSCQKAHGDPPSFSCSTSCPAPIVPALPMAPAPPEPVRPPSLRACQGASRQADAAGVRWCDPPARQRCGEGSWQGPDDDRCSPLLDCAAPPVVPADALWVSPGASGGDGSRARPYGALSTALMNVRAGGTISLIGRGHLAAVTLSSNVSLLAACDSELVLDPDASGVALRVDTEEATVLGLRVAGRLVLEPNRRLVLERAAVQGNIALGAAASLTVQRAEVLGTITLSPGAILRANELSALGDVRTIDAAPGAEVELRGSVLRSTGAGPTIAATGAQIFAEHSLLISERATLELEAQSQAQIIDSSLVGAIVARSSVVSTEETVLHGASPAALHAQGSRVSLSDLLITATSTSFTVLSSTATLARVRVSALGGAGLIIRSSSVSAVDLQMQEDNVRILDAVDSAISLSRAILSGVMGCEASSFKMSDVESRGSTLRVLSGCRAELQRASWRGYFVARPSLQAHLRLEDVAIDADQKLNALSLDSNTVTELARVSVMGAPQAIDVRDGAELRGTDLDVDNSGGGIALTMVGAVVNLSRFRVYSRTDRPGLGGLASNESQLRGSDWTIEGLRDQGLSFNTGPPAELTRVKIANIAQVGLRLDEAGLSSSSTGVEIQGCGVGIELAPETPWTEALANITLRSNRVPLSSP